MGSGFDPEWIKYTPEDDWRRYFSAFGFFMAMVYTFVGIAISSDMFMSSIEVICGATKTVKDRKESDGVIIITTKKVAVWNETVANLTLMALGSSAPEILLSTIEICSGLDRHQPGELGPGTIVGSAAFNLMIISAVCIFSVPKGGTSRIKLYSVFAVTCVVSLFAYIWMAVVLSWVTPDEVTIWEAFMTLLFFPILIVTAYLTDRQFFKDKCQKKRQKRMTITSAGSGASNAESQREFVFSEEDQFHLFDEEGNYDKDGIASLYNRLREIAVLTDKEIVCIIATKLIENKQHPKTWYKTKASKALIGGGTMEPVLDKKLKEVKDILEEGHMTRYDPRRSTVVPVSAEVLRSRAVVEFQAAAMAVPEAIGEFDVIIKRSGREDIGFDIHVETVDGSAKSGLEYEPVSEVIKFDPYVMEMPVQIKIIDNVQWNPDLNFYLHLSTCQGFETKAVLGRMRVLEIIIEDDDKPGKLTFTKQGFLFKETDRTAEIDVVRKKGADGLVAVSWTVIPGPRSQLIPLEQAGRLEFQHKEIKKYIKIPFNTVDAPIKTQGKDETFDVLLHDPEGGAKLGKIIHITCAISNDEHFKLEIQNIVEAAVELAEESEKPATWKEQICRAVCVNGGDRKNAKCSDWFLHIIFFPWKFICSLIPPPHLCRGWLCFLISLTFIGFCTKLVGEFAEKFGEALGINPTITAITFVALGTSLPDTFASRIAAMNDKTADNAIGNVTGSNSVNVFLGLGVPWVIGSLFYKFKPTLDVTKDEVINPFCVPAGSLTFNVLIYSACATVTLLILVFRRYSSLCGRAELGGPRAMKWVTGVIMVLMWCVYIAISSWEASTNTVEKALDQDHSYCRTLVDHFTRQRKRK